MKYLKCILNYRIIYQSEQSFNDYQHQVQDWTNSKWTSNEDSQRITSNYALANRAISCQSWHQPIIALSYPNKIHSLCFNHQRYNLD